MLLLIQRVLYEIKENRRDKVMGYTKEELERASRIASEGLKLPSGWLITALRNWSGKFIPNKKRLSDKDKEKLQKTVKKKGGMR